MPEEWKFGGTRRHVECPTPHPHDAHLWSPTKGNPCEEDQVTEDIQMCLGGQLPHDPTVL